MRVVTRWERRKRLAKYVCVSLTYACVVACGGEDHEPQTHDLLDAGTPTLDASSRIDASARDAALDAASDDAGDVPNACRVLAGTDSVVAERFFDPQGAISVAIHSQAALLSWSQYSAGKAHVHSRWFGVSADPVDAPVVEEDVDQVDAYSAAIATGFLTTWNEAGELRARRTADDGSTVGTPISLSDDDFTADRAVSAQGADGNIVLALASGSQGGTLLLGPDATPIANLFDVPGFGASVGRPALAAYQAGYVLAWVDATTRRVRMQYLDAAGTSSSLGMTIDSDGDAQGNLDLATTASNGAVAWDVLVAGQRAEVHLRTFGANANPTGIEQTLTPYPDTGLHPALVATRGGYLVAYRGEQALRVVMLDNRGKRSASRDIASLLQQDLPLALRMTDDGSHVFVGWLDQTPNTTEYQLQKTWIGCD